MAQCSKLNARGEPCGFAAPDGRNVCWNHDATRRGAAQQARRKGGQNRVTPPSGKAPGVNVTSIEGVQSLLTHVVEETLMQSNSAQRSKILIAAAGVALQAVEKGAEMGEIKELLAELEEQRRSR